MIQDTRMKLLQTLADDERFPMQNQFKFYDRIMDPVRNAKITHNKQSEFWESYIGNL